MNQKLLPLPLGAPSQEEQNSADRMEDMDFGVLLLKAEMGVVNKEMETVVVEKNSEEENSDYFENFLEVLNLQKVVEIPEVEENREPVEVYFPGQVLLLLL